MGSESMVDLHDAAAENLYPALFQCFTIILCGYVAGRMNAVTPTEAKGIGTFVGTFALPSLIFLSLAKLDFSTVNWTFLLSILLAKGIVFFSVIIVTTLISKPVNLGRAGIFAIFCTQSNDFALGYPIINAIYHATHPEYALFLYLMAPISLAILNPVAFVLMEVHNQRENIRNIDEGQRKVDPYKLRLLRQILKGVTYNPVLIMTILGIIANVITRHNLSVYITALLEVFGQAFSATALFLLGLQMVGQIHRLRGPALLLPCVLIMVKLIILPVVMREFVSAMNAGGNETETLSLSTYAFLYGTIPTAPAVFVFSNLFQLEIDLVASSMVICTFLSAPIIFMSAEVISLNKDYAEQLKRFGFGLSIVALVAILWVLLVFAVTKKYKRMPHRLTLCLLLSQLLLAVAVIWGGPSVINTPSWHLMIQQAVRVFSMYSCLLWTSMLSVGLLLLQSRGPCFVVTLWPVLGFVAWGIPTVMVGVLLATKSGPGELDLKCIEAIRLCLLVFCLTVSSGCLILYMRYRRRSEHFATLSADLATGSNSDEVRGLVENAEPLAATNSVANTGALDSEEQGCYGTITSSSSNGCCVNDPNCGGGGGAVNQANDDLESVQDNENKDCACPSSQKNRCGTTGPCQYLNDLDEAASRMGLLPPELSRGRGGQLLKHTVLIILYSLSMFLGITYTTWRMMSKDESGVFIEIQFVDIAVNYGQGLVMFILFGLDPNEIIIPAVRYFKTKWHGEDTVVLPPVEDLSFETKHVCDQFITHHLDRCKEAIAKDSRWRMRTYRNVFRGSCLVRWLIDCGLARDEHEAVVYGCHLLDGRLIAHVNNAHHFTNSPLLYTFT